jgi:hypothetical protein
MAVQLKGQTTWDAKAKERRADEATALYDAFGITSEDVIRFPKRPGDSSSKVTGKALSVNNDGSVTCSAAGRIRAVVPEKIEVKTRGPRGGVNWVPLVPEKA